MTIDGWDIASANAKQFQVVWGYSEYSNRSEWVTGSRMPVLLAGNTGFKPLRVVMVVKGDGREAIRTNVSKILARLTGPVDITLDGFTHKFRGKLRAHSANEMSRRRWHALTLDLDGYEYSDQVTVSGSTSISVTNPGTLPTPAVVTITPTAGMSNLTIEGLGDTITLANIESGKPVIINGETGLITQDGALKDADLYSLPAVQPGSSVVTCNRSQAQISIAFKPRFA